MMIKLSKSQFNYDLRKIQFIKVFVRQQNNMEEVIRDFFERFRSDITQSRYYYKGLQDYQKLKTYYDYLDYDKNSIFRNKNDNQPCGLRNIGNTCYLNVFLQVLYHVNFLRQKIFSYEHPNNPKFSILQEIKLLFGRMQLGKLSYTDPTQLYEKLKQKYPSVFVDGIQNDFHEICTLLVDELKQSLKQISQNDSKIMDKMLFGKLSVRTYHSEGKSLRNTRFNIINLDSSYGSLQKALEHWKTYDIEDYLTENKKIVKASVQTQFIQSPALLTFFINRVSYKNGSLVKDNREFKFDNDFFLQKSSSSSANSSYNNVTKGNKIPGQITKKPSQKQQQLLDSKQKLLSWISSIQKEKQCLMLTIKYLDQKQFTNIGVPQIQNKYQSQSHSVKIFLQEQANQIELKQQQAKKQIFAIQDKIARLYEENQTQVYHLWGMMIHEGTNPNSGHYKVVLNSDNNKWIQFNDRKVEFISIQKIQTYTKRGQICCLFYRRPTLNCNDKKVTVPISLKTTISQIQKDIMKQIDKARILQNLYQLNQSSGILLQHEIKQRNINKYTKWFYFYRPLLYCLEENYNFIECQGLITYQNLKEESNIMNLQSSFLVQKKLKVPELGFNIPSEYYKYSEVFRKFLDKEKFIENMDEAYQQLSDSLAIPCKKKTVAKWIEKYLQIFVMKGVFFLCVLYRISLTPLLQAKFTRLFNSIQNIMKKLNSTSDFTLTYIPIKDQIQKLFIKKTKSHLGQKDEATTKILKHTPNAFISKVIYQNQCQLFKKEFGYWIDKRENLKDLDEGIIHSQAKMHMEYIIQIC